MGAPGAAPAHSEQPAHRGSERVRLCVRGLAPGQAAERVAFEPASTRSPVRYRPAIAPVPPLERRHQTPPATGLRARTATPFATQDSRYGLAHNYRGPARVRAPPPKGPRHPGPAA